ncbi:hypothetical protein EJ08DRAFT_657143 [Tothia fuscella]|uniref:Uncharacterized protein n=1 Tax=Tothia fuscella TaxID=1048955 RepID=A0A9P4NZ86_9PEZI|nr:hypothetical protein EJ08DRAFT_657143 [Tothia fuscella]
MDFQNGTLVMCSKYPLAVCDLPGQCSFHIRTRKNTSISSSTSGSEGTISEAGPGDDSGSTYINTELAQGSTASRHLETFRRSDCPEPEEMRGAQDSPAIVSTASNDYGEMDQVENVAHPAVLRKRQRGAMEGRLRKKKQKGEQIILRIPWKKYLPVDGSTAYQTRWDLPGKVSKSKNLRIVFPFAALLRSSRKYDTFHTTNSPVQLAKHS